VHSTMPPLSVERQEVSTYAASENLASCSSNLENDRFRAKFGMEEAMFGVQHNLSNQNPSYTSPQHEREHRLSDSRAKMAARRAKKRERVSKANEKVGSGGCEEQVEQSRPQSADRFRHPRRSMKLQFSRDRAGQGIGLADSAAGGGSSLQGDEWVNKRQLASKRTDIVQDIALEAGESRRKSIMSELDETKSAGGNLSKRVADVGPVLGKSTNHSANGPHCDAAIRLYVRCPLCSLMLVPPPGAPKFLCECRAILKVPSNLIRSSPSYIGQLDKISREARSQAVQKRRGELFELQQQFLQVQN